MAKTINLARYKVSFGIVNFKILFGTSNEGEVKNLESLYILKTESILNYMQSSTELLIEDT